MNWAPSSVASTLKPLAAPSASIAAIPWGMESWRKPAVFEKTRTLSSGSSSTVTVPVMPVWKRQRKL